MAKVNVIGWRYVDFVEQNTNKRIQGITCYYLKEIPKQYGCGSQPEKLFINAANFDVRSIPLQTGVYDFEMGLNREILNVSLIG